LQKLTENIFSAQFRAGEDIMKTKLAMLVVVLASVFLTGACATTRHGPAVPGGSRSELVHPFVNQYFIVVTNESDATIDILVNGVPYAVLDPAGVYTHVVETSRLSSRRRGIRADLVITAVGTFQDGTFGSFSRKISVSSTSRRSETRSREVRVRLRRIRSSELPRRLSRPTSSLPAPPYPQPEEQEQGEEQEDKPPAVGVEIPAD
jgi:predicted small secreted protein